MMMLHKFNRRLLSGGLLAAFAVAGVIGCGGSSAGVPQRDTVQLSGGASSQTGTSDNAAPANPNGQTISINGGSGTAYLAPTTDSTPAGTTLTIIPTGTTIFAGLTRTASRAPGDVFVNGVNSGLTVTQNGSLSGNLALLNNRKYTIYIQGPFYITNGSRTLTINEGFEFDVLVRNNTASLPNRIEGTIPSDGGTASDMFLTVNYPSIFTGDSIELSVTKSNGNVSQSRTLLEAMHNEMVIGQATFRDFVPDVVVPEEGVQRVSLFFNED